MLDRLTGITQETTSSVLASYAYTFDPVGNRLGVTEADGSSFAWTYDDAYRLTGETRLDSGGSTISQTSFAYDPVGNRVSMTVDGATKSYSYNNLDQLLSAGGTSFGYDPRGNLTQASSAAGVTAYLWDALDRLSDITLPDGTSLAYTYDADGRRVRQVADGSETNYLWDEASPFGDVVYETTGSSTTSYVLGGTELLSQTRDGVTSYYLHDGQTSVRGLTDASGAVTDTYTYSAYGELLSRTGSTANAYLYTGQQFDALTGQYYLRARYYDPGRGRFLSRDPLAVQPFNPIEINRYVYAANNPANRMDPTGAASFSSKALRITLVTIPALPALRELGRVIAKPLILTLATVLVAQGAPDVVEDLPEVWKVAIGRVFERAVESLEEGPENLEGPEPEPISVDVFPPLPTPGPDDKGCEPSELEAWWWGLGDVLKLVPEGDSDYEYEVRVAQAGGRFDAYSKDIPILGETVPADGIEPPVCRLVEAKDADDNGRELGGAP